MATDGGQPAEVSLSGTRAALALTVPPVIASLFPGILGRIRTRSVPRLSFSYVFCLLHPHPWLQSPRSPPEDLWLIETPPVHRVHARLLLATKQLFLDGGLVHSGGHGQGKEGQSASRWPRNADPEAPSRAFRGCVTLSKWPPLSEPAHSCCFSMSFKANAAQLHKRGHLRTGSLEEPTWRNPPLGCLNK